MQVNYNISAMIANNALVANDNKLAESIERLSSGLKIANAKDNPSGLAISRRMNAQIKSLGVAVGNSGDGVSVIQTADGTLSEVHDILQRMSELAIQAANGTNSETDLSIIQEEIIQLKDEITRISEATQFNGQTLLDGTFDNRGYCTIDGVTDPEITINSYIDFVAEKGKHVSLEEIEGFEPSSDIPAELELVREDRAKMLRKLISELPVPYCEVVTLVDLQEMEHTEAAELLGIDKNLLKVRLFRARKALEKMINANIAFFK